MTSLFCLYEVMKMKLKNGQIVIYEINKKYMDYLRKYDHRVSVKQNRRFLGIVVSNKGVDYCIPLSTKVYTSNGKRRLEKFTTFILRNKNPIGVLLYNNMVPVIQQELRIVDVSSDPDKDYLMNEIRFLHRHINEIEKKAEYVYRNYNKNNFTKTICINIGLLEKKRKEWIKQKDNVNKQKNIPLQSKRYFLEQEFSKINSIALDNISEIMRRACYVLEGIDYRNHFAGYKREIYPNWATEKNIEILKEWNHSFQYAKAMSFYNIQKSNDNQNPFSNKYTEKYANELIYCYQHDLSLLDFHLWTYYEELINGQITFDEYVKLDSKQENIFDVNLKDQYKINEIRQELKDMREEPEETMESIEEDEMEMEL